MAKYIQYYFESINNSVSPFLMKDGEVSLLLNGYHSEIGVISKRNGVVYTGDQTGTGDILGVHGAITGLSDGAGGYKRELYQVSTVSGTTAIKYLNSSTWTSLSGAGTGLTGGEDFEFETFLNYTFVVSPSNAPRTIAGSDGTTVSTTAQLLGAPAKASHITSWFNKVYMANCTIGSGVYPSRVYFSSIPLGIVTVAKGDQVGVTTSVLVADNRYLKVGDTIDIYRAGSSTSIVTGATISSKTGRDEITLSSSLGSVTIYAGDEIWLASTRESYYEIVWDTNLDWFSVGENDGEGINRILGLGSQLLICKPTSIWVFNESSLRSISQDGVGALSGKSVAVGNQGALFLSRDGFYRVYNNSVRKVSAKIDKLVSGISDTNKKTAVGWIKGDKYYCYVASLNILNNDNSVKRTITDVVFVYNMSQNNWTLYTGFKVTAASNYPVSDTEYSYLGSGSGRVLQAFTGHKDQIGSSSYQGIPFELETKDYYLAEPDRFLEYKELHPISNMMNGLKGMYSIEGGSYNDLIGSRNLERMQFGDKAYGRNLRLKFVHNDQTPCKINGFTLKYGEKESQFEN